MAHAETLTIEGRNVYTTLTVSAGSASVTISYTEGSGQLWAKVEGEASNNIIPTMMRIVQGPRNSNPTPGGVSSSVEAPSGWKFFAANSTCEYELPINGTTYKGIIPERKGV